MPPATCLCNSQASIRLCPSICLFCHSTAAAAYGGVAAGLHAGTRYQLAACTWLPGTQQQWRCSTVHSTALCSKCGQCYVDSWVDEAEHRLVKFTNLGIYTTTTILLPLYRSPCVGDLVILISVVGLWAFDRVLSYHKSLRTINDV